MATTDVLTKRVNYTTAQVNVPIITPAVGERIIVTGIVLTAAANNADPTLARVAFGSSFGSGGEGFVLDHPGASPGGGVVYGGGGGVIGMGAVNESLLVSSGNPSPGSVSIVVTYKKIS